MFRLVCFMSELPPRVGERLHCDWAKLEASKNLAVLAGL